jgi:predicted regulator of Ras-like GTPase activity (Roadblock/LC7/MglB family)
MSEIGFGEVEQILVELGDFKLWIMKFEKYRFVLCCSADVNLGALKIRVVELLEHMRSILQVSSHLN